MIRVRLPVAKYWREISLAGLAAAAVIALLIYRLGSLARNFSPGELQAHQATASIGNILLNPLHLPLKLFGYLAHFAPPSHAVTIARLPSVVAAVGAAALMVYILRRWYGRRSMIYGFFIFVCSAWFLHVGRFAGFDVDYLLGMLALLAIHVTLQDNIENPYVFVGWLLVNILLLFIPGFIWFVLLSMIWQFRVVYHAWQALDAAWTRGLVILLAVLGVLGPVVSIIWTPSLLWPWLGLPPSLPHWHDWLDGIGHTVAAIAYMGPHRPELWLGQLPILDIFMSGMLLAGLVFYAQHLRAARTQLLLSYLLLGIIISSLGIVGVSVIVPILYIIAVGGIAYVLYFWLRVFPRNPLARYLGLGLVCLAIGLSCSYNLTMYFEAWPHNPETVAAYHLNHR